MQLVARYETERAQVVCKPLISFNAQVLPRFAAQVAQVARKPLKLQVPRFCPGLPHYSPYNPHTGCTRLGAVRTRNEEDFERRLIGVGRDWERGGLTLWRFPAHLASARTENALARTPVYIRVISWSYGRRVPTILTATIPPVLSIGSLSLDTLSRELTGPNGTVRLHRSPYLVLRDLMRRPGVIVSLDQMISTAWPEPDLQPANPETAIRMAVRRARDALEQVGVPAKRLALAFMAGYVMQRDPLVARFMTREQAALVDQMLAAQKGGEIPCT